MKLLAKCVTTIICADNFFARKLTIPLVRLINVTRPQSDICGCHVKELLNRHNGLRAADYLVCYAQLDIIPKERLNWGCKKTLAALKSPIDKFNFVVRIAPFCLGLDVIAQFKNSLRINGSRHSANIALLEFITSVEANPTTWLALKDYISRQPLTDLITLYRLLDLTQHNPWHQTSEKFIGITPLIHKVEHTSEDLDEPLVTELGPLVIPKYVESELNSSVFFSVSELHCTVKPSIRRHAVVLMESGADIRDLLKDPALSDYNFSVYAVNAVNMGMSDPRVKVKSLRDLLLDNDPYSRELFSISGAYTDALRKVILETSDIGTLVSEQTLTVILRGLEDKISTNLIMQECYARAVQQESDADCFIIVLRSGRTFLPIVENISKYADHGKISVYCKNNEDLSLVETHPTFLKSLTQRDALFANQDELSALDALHLADIVNSGKQPLIDYASSFKSLLPKGTSLVASMFNVITYAETAEVLINELLETRPLCLAMTEAGVIDWNHEFASKIKNQYGMRLMELSLTVARRHSSTTKDVYAALTHLGLTGIRKTSKCSAEVVGDSKALIEIIAADYFGGNFQRQFWNAIFLKEVIDPAIFECIYISSTRSPNQGILGSVSLENGVPCLDVQVLNIHAHPKYKRPTSTKAVVIDSIAEKVYTDYFGMDSEDVLVLGSPTSDKVLAKVRMYNRVEVAAKLNLSSVSEQAVLFASQLQPIERTTSILRQLVSACKAVGATLIVKPHPREEINRIKDYENIIATSGDPQTMVVATNCNVYELITLTSLTVTMFSNVAREAFLCGHSVVIADYFNSKHPINYVEEGIAVGAYSENELYLQVVDFLTKGDFNFFSDYKKKNQHLFVGDSAKKIVAMGSSLSGQNAADPKIISVIPSSFSPLWNITELISHTLRINDELLLQKVLLAIHVNDLKLDSPASYLKLLLIHAIELCQRGWLADMLKVLLLKNFQLKQLLAELFEGNPKLQEMVAYTVALVKANEVCANRGWAYVQNNNQRNALETLGRALTEQLNALDLRMLSFQLCQSIRMLSGKSLPVDLPFFQYQNCMPELQIFHEQPVAVFLLTPMPQNEVIRLVEDIRLTRSGPLYLFCVSAIELSDCPAGCTLVSVSDFDDEQNQDVNLVMAPVLESMQTKFYHALSEVLADTCLQEFSTECGHALKNWLRLVLISEIRKSLTFRKALAAFDITELIIQFTAEPQILPFRGVNFADLNISNVTFYMWSVKGTASQSVPNLVGKAMDPDYLHPSLKRQPNKNWFKKQLEELLASDQFCYLPDSSEKTHLFLVNMTLKTVPPTVAPIIKNLLHTDDVLMVDVGKGALDTNLHRQFSEAIAGNTGRFSYVNTRDYSAKGLKNEVTNYLTSVVSEIFCRELSIAGQDIDLRVQMSINFGRFFTSAFWYYVRLYRVFGAFFARSSRGALVVCPGRAGEAFIAQDVAQRFYVPSVDLMNAYMSAGYTYVAPYGDYVTAIDSWSRDLLVNHFGLAEDKILLFGTPRFDSVAEFALQKDALPSESYLNRIGDKLVLLATQPVEVRKTFAMIAALAKVPSEQVLDIVVKLHPRDTDDFLAEVNAYITSHQSRHHFIVSRDANIYDLIRQSDLVVTMFSNVGIEAAIADKNLLVSNLDRDQMPLPLDEFNIGFNAYSEDEFIQGVLGMLYDTQIQKEVRNKRYNYFNKNKHLLRGDSVKLITDFVKSLNE